MKLKEEINERTEVMKEFSHLAADYFDDGCSCSEAVVKAAYDSGLIDKNINYDTINMISSSFSGAMGTNECLCGAVAGSQIVLGLVFGRKNCSNDPYNIRKISKGFIEEFKQKRKTTCCRALRAKYKDNPIANRANCSAIVAECAEIIQKTIKERTAVPTA